MARTATALGMLPLLLSFLFSSHAAAQDADQVLIDCIIPRAVPTPTPKPVPSPIIVGDNLGDTTVFLNGVQVATEEIVPGTSLTFDASGAVPGQNTVVITNGTSEAQIDFTLATRLTDDDILEALDCIATRAIPVAVADGRILDPELADEISTHLLKAESTLLGGIVQHEEKPFFKAITKSKKSVMHVSKQIDQVLFDQAQQLLEEGDADIRIDPLYGDRLNEVLTFLLSALDAFEGLSLNPFDGPMTHGWNEEAIPLKVEVSLKHIAVWLIPHELLAA